MRFPHRVNGEVRLLRRRRRSRCGCAGVGGSAAWREEQREGEERNGEQAHEWICRLAGGEVSSGPANLGYPHPGKGAELDSRVARLKVHSSLFAAPIYGGVRDPMPRPAATCLSSSPPVCAIESCA